MKKFTLIILIAIALGALLPACSTTPAPRYAEIPAGRAYANGNEIFFSGQRHFHRASRFAGQQRAERSQWL